MEVNANSNVLSPKRARLAFALFDSSSSDGSLSASSTQATSAIAYLQQNTQIIVTIIERCHGTDGNDNETGDHQSSAIWRHRKIQGTDASALFEVKDAIDAFVAAQQDDVALAVLGRYDTNVSGLDNWFTPYEYGIAKRLVSYHRLPFHIFKIQL